MNYEILHQSHPRFLNLVPAFKTHFPYAINHESLIALYKRRTIYRKTRK